jgi:hypothetical protein
MPKLLQEACVSSSQLSGWLSVAVFPSRDGDAVDAEQQGDLALVQSRRDSDGAPFLGRGKGAVASRRSFDRHPHRCV